jgi:Sulfotransferase family
LARGAARERFTEVDYEELIADREAVTRQLIAFTGLDWLGELRELLPPT